jgi:3-hexulose-6-phosphate synthase
MPAPHIKGDFTVVTERIHFNSQGDADIINLTADTRRLLEESGLTDGVATVFVPGAPALSARWNSSLGWSRTSSSSSDRLAPVNHPYNHNVTHPDENGHATSVPACWARRSRCRSRTANSVSADGRRSVRVLRQSPARTHRHRAVRRRHPLVPTEEHAMEPVLQLALDFVDLPRALRVAEEAVAGGADWLEAGTPLIKSEGLQALRELKNRFPGKTLVADMKTMDAGRAEVEFAAKAGAHVVGVLGAASAATIRECIEAGQNYGAQIIVDMLQVDDVVARAREVEAMGADYIGIHVAIDEQMEGKMPFDILQQVASAVSIPVSVAGGINSETAPLALEAGASIVVGVGCHHQTHRQPPRHHPEPSSRRWPHALR